MKNILISLLALVAAYGAIVGSVALVGGNQQPTASFGQAGTRFPHGVQIGLPANSPTNIGDIKAGTCNLVGMDVSQPASSTASYDCAVAGVVSTDIVMGELSTSTQNTSVLNWFVSDGRASTTPGFLTFRVTNLSGAAATPSVSAVGSSTEYVIVRTQ